VEAFVYKFEVFKKITRFFEDISRKIKTGGFLKTLTTKLRVFLNGCEAFLNYFQRN
jgi:hypothetical protein